MPNPCSLNWDRSWGRRGTVACRCPRPKSTSTAARGGPDTSQSPTNSILDLATGERPNLQATKTSNHRQIWPQTQHRAQFKDMVRRCNAVNVNIIVDLVINHMSGRDSRGPGFGGSDFDGGSRVKRWMWVIADNNQDKSVSFSSTVLPRGAL